MDDILKTHRKNLFDDHAMTLQAGKTLTEVDKDRLDLLKQRMSTLYRLNLALYHGDHLVGWSFGVQDAIDAFYMCNSAIFPKYRRQGLYTSLLKTVLEIVTEQGFQRIYSRHKSTNNAVIIPKLKVDFKITGLEVNDVFGILVHLSYFPKEIRRKVLEFRVGNIPLDDEIKKYFNP
ncbi:MAG: GNAT family N-acetyltransferase [Oligoflexia bacterium]|nr:GNAT family N-acetyltransferase [Oligoflexia bacterium]